MRAQEPTVPPERARCARARVAETAANNAELAGPAAESSAVAAPAATAAECSAVPVVTAVEHKLAAAFESERAQELAAALELKFVSSQSALAEHQSAVVQCADGIAEPCRSAVLEAAPASDSRALAGHRVDAQAGLLCHGRHCRAGELAARASPAGANSRKCVWQDQSGRRLPPENLRGAREA